MAGTVKTTNALLGLALLLLVVCGLPPACSLHSQLRRPLVGALASVGLCQPEWRLFGPNVHKTNSRLVADVELESGELRRWSSPDFRDRSLLQKLAQGQLPKLYDNLRLDRNRAAWRPFAAWVAREVAGGQRVRSVRLARRFYDIPPPHADGRSPSPLRRYESHVFYERRF